MAQAVLIVDDEQHIRLLIEQTLEELLEEDVELYTAADGDEAMAAIAAQHPDLVFLDVMMPGRSGLDVCRAVRADPELAGAHVVLLTAVARHRTGEVWTRAPTVLTKPFDPDAPRAARGVLLA
jgi:CheY-like chemotaxis protein